MSRPAAPTSGGSLRSEIRVYAVTELPDGAAADRLAGCAATVAAVRERLGQEAVLIGGPGITARLQTEASVDYATRGARRISGPSSPVRRGCVAVAIYGGTSPTILAQRGILYRLASGSLVPQFGVVNTIHGQAGRTLFKESGRHRKVGLLPGSAQNWDDARY